MEYNITDCNPVKCGIQIDPPSFVLFYKSKEKLKKKVMPLRRFKVDSNIQFVAHDLKKRHNLEGVTLLKIEKMLRLLQELLKGTDKENALKKVESEFTIKTNEDLNKLSTQELEHQKQLMDSLFTKNQVKKDSPDFVYDKQVDFDNLKEESNWDKEADIENEKTESNNPEKIDTDIDIDVDNDDHDPDPDHDHDHINEDFWS